MKDKRQSTCCLAGSIRLGYSASSMCGIKGYNQIRLSKKSSHATASTGRPAWSTIAQDMPLRCAHSACLLSVFNESKSVARIKGDGVESFLDHCNVHALARQMRRLLSVNSNYLRSASKGSCIRICDSMVPKHT